MSFVGGRYADMIGKGADGLPKILGGAPGDGPIKGFVPGEIAHITAPNAKTQIFIDTQIGKGTDIFMGFLWQMRKKGYHVQKVTEMMEISPVHSQYYQLTVQQKQNLETQIKNSLAGIHHAIEDYELLTHDMRRYKEYMNYLNGVEEGTKTKNADMVKKNNQTLKSIFIDQVDVHTGEGVALKLIVSRWPTIIVDFMKIGDDDTDPGKIAEKYGFSEAEGVVLATKNKIYMQWRELFKGTVTSRYEHLKEMTNARKVSIQEYRNMAKPYVMRHKMIREMGETTEGRTVLRGFSWWRPSSQAVSIDIAEYWLWRPFSAPELHRAPTQLYKEKLDVMRSDLGQTIKAEMMNHPKLSGEKVDTFPTGIEPLDDWVYFLTGEMVKWYREKRGYKANLDIEDMWGARKKLVDMFAEYTRWDWIPSPYFSVLEVNTVRVVSRSPNGSEVETLVVGSYPDMPLAGYFDTQNVILLRLLEEKIQEKELESYVTEIVGETVGGKSAKEAAESDYPYLYGKEPKKADGKRKMDVKMPKLTGRGLGSKIGFMRPGPYDTTFMERVAAIMVKSIGQNAYGPAVKYFKSAAMG